MQLMVLYFPETFYIILFCDGVPLYLVYANRHLFYLWFPS